MKIVCYLKNPDKHLFISGQDRINTTLGDENSESLAYVNIKTVSSADIQGDKGSSLVLGNINSFLSSNAGYGFLM